MILKTGGINDAENSALNTLHFKTVILNCNNILLFLLYYLLNKYSFSECLCINKHVRVSSLSLYTDRVCFASSVPLSLAGV